ncbi:MAG TPA: hypothetical protein VLZ12_05600 [Verrucomicrobiae bacterium]|nr:hypothetical protein [Verrucomicrobiae bacterium]
MKKPGVIVVAVLLAVGSFAFARYRYMDRNTAHVGSQAVTNPLADKSLFGDWVKDEWPFAIAIPVAVLAAGFVLATRK